MLNQDYRDMLLSLKEEKVDFIIVGAYALAAHGNPRATGDIDIWIRNTVENGKNVILALAKFGAPITGISVTDFTADDLILQIGVEPCRVDLITGIDGVSFKEAWESKRRRRLIAPHAAFAGAALTTPLTKGSAAPFGNPR